MVEIEQKNNLNFGEFFIVKQGKNVGKMQYEWSNPLTFNIVHTEVDPEFEGQGFGKKLVNAAVDFARKEGKTIKATCSYAHSVLSKDDSVEDVFTK
ncbi:GNAT family N-acetyltransferase [Halpernia frigidisoli]|uniref:Uncharacterized protein n=1 Tax=Halpernia frigidisoli TaxID=1125876 RepID=A0A1I3ED17_9FLAO|nr:GNAT family N-acetyltransferase [Halpernia frigidisoli]SFH96864.1 hypothetical protein SAMN05443292_1008 [Halpernia frigidisoli]